MRKTFLGKAVGILLSAAMLTSSLSTVEMGITVRAARPDKRPGQDDTDNNTNNSVGTSTMPSEEGPSFDGAYKKIGDTLTVVGAEAGSSYEWTVTSQITGEVVKTETNTTGTFETSMDYNECLITCKIGDVQVAPVYCSTIPVMYINSEKTYYNVKDDYCDVKMKLTGSDSFSDETQWYEGGAEIKRRGNSTKRRPKRSFKVKLEQKTNLLGLGDEEDGSSYKSKHWVLLANDIDHSLVRNKLLYDFSGAIGTEYYFHSTSVTLVFNGEYMGVYQLCEHRRVDDGRIDIYDWVDKGEDAAQAIAKKEWQTAGYPSAEEMETALNAVMYQDYSWMDTQSVTLGNVTYQFKEYDIELKSATGGYLAEMDFYSIESNEQATMKTAYGQPLYVSAPEAGSELTDSSKIRNAVSSFKNTALYNYANTYTQTFEYALHSMDFRYDAETTYQTVSGNPQYDYMKDDWTGISYIANSSYSDIANDGKHYSELFDMDSLVTNFLFVEYAMNWDSMKNSFFYYKDIEGLAKIGPQWDFDWCWGNTNMYNIDTNQPTAWHTTLQYFTREQSYQAYQWNRLLIKDPYFLVRAYEKYQKIRPIIEEMIKEGGLIDQYYSELLYAGQANDAKWSYTYTTEYSGARAEGFEASVTSIKNFLNTRVAWMDEQFASVDTLISSLGYYQVAEDIQILSIDSTESEGNVLVRATTVNPNCKSVVFQVNGSYETEAVVTDGVAEAYILEDALIQDGTTLNVITAYEADKKGSYIQNTSLKPNNTYESIAKSAYTTFLMKEGEKVDVVTSLAAPSVKPVSATVPTLKWAKVNGATKYEIYRKLKSEKTFKLLATTKKKTYKDKKAKVNKAYAYYVVAVGKKLMKSMNSKEVMIQMPKQVISLKISGSSATKIKVTYKKVSGATGYEIYRSTKKKSGYQKIATVKKAKTTSYKDKSGKKGKKYYYKVRAYKLSDGVKIYGQYSTVKSTK